MRPVSVFLRIDCCKKQKLKLGFWQVPSIKFCVFHNVLFSFKLDLFEVFFSDWYNGLSKILLPSGTMKYTHAIVVRIPDTVQFSEKEKSTVNVALAKKQLEDLSESLRKVRAF